jgi:hypothetical protein
MGYLQLYCDVLDDWPSGSLDMNPIENVWAILKRRISGLQIQKLEDRETIIVDTRNSITQEEMTNLILSMPGRLRATVAAQRGPNGS